MEGTTGEPLAVIDGLALPWRTAAASAFAAFYLAREEASRLVMGGAGALARYLIAAQSVRHIIEMVAWNRNVSWAEELAASLGDCPYSVRAATDLEHAVRLADVVSRATLSSEPLVRGAWLRPGSASGSRRRLHAEDAPER
jgi:ornithine cyclodeaminase